MSNQRTDRGDSLNATAESTEPTGPLAVIQLSLKSREAAKALFPDYRLSRLVCSRLDMDDLEMADFSCALSLDADHPFLEQRRPFDHHLRHVIAQYGLQLLFSDDGPGPYHHAVRPTGYDFHADAVIPPDMEKWRADYRAMPAHRQMLAASISTRQFEPRWSAH